MFWVEARIPAEVGTPAPGETPLPVYGAHSAAQALRQPVHASEPFPHPWGTSWVYFNQLVWEQKLMSQHSYSCKIGAGTRPVKLEIKWFLF